MPWDVSGHVIKQGDKFCTICGKPPVTKCGNGHEIREEFNPYGEAVRPNHCHECGLPYPWTRPAV